MLATASGSSMSLAPSIIAAAAALLGVGIGQLISLLQRRHDEQQRRLERIADSVSKTLAFSMDAVEQIHRGSGAGLNWWAQPEWIRLHSERWPIVRDLLLQQVAYEQPDTKPSFLAIAIKIQDLMTDENMDKETALQSWTEVQEDTGKLQRQASRTGTAMFVSRVGDDKSRG